ncbi:MAG: carbohydrate binding family 9 domain-containing protein [bacterium]|nr:carbohydrate binding family 9 domain-containing protein [bacterium]
MKKVNLVTLVSVLLVLFSVSYGDAIRQRVIEAVRLEEPVKVDGVLEENVWQGRGYSGFIQSDPTEGAPASEETIVWVAYDDKAIYISARLMDSEPEKIIGLLGRRDNFVESDWFIFSVDPYYDRRSGYQFAVNPAGTIVDWTIFNDEGQDSTWDGVWESRTQIDEKGWSVEMRIPFEQLRFKKKDRYVWGVDFQRRIKRKNERNGIVYVPKKDSGYVSHFARLEGISGINPGRFIEMTPYSIGKAAFGSKELGNPFQTGKDFLSNGGLDMKVGLKSNLTLDLTMNPDFGQVEVDPAVINLGAGESYYGEHRPFFVEGANIFSFGYGGSNRNIGANWGNPQFFYSRRIGRPPQGGVNSDGYVRYPEWSTILGAAKLTGKVGNDWNVGFLSALTQREYADVDLNGDRSRYEVEPLSYYGVLRAQKEFNRGRQGLGFITTSVLRDVKSGEMQDTVNKNAFSFGLDGWTFLDKNKTWVVSGWFGGTRVTGSEEAIWNLQQSYPHYYQGPDASHVELDAGATSMSGWAGRVSLNKQKGNFIFNAALGAISPGFDSRDMGFQWDADIINGHIMVGYRSFKPGKIFRNWGVSLFTQRNYDFDGNKTGEQRLIFIADAQLKNYWNISAQFSHNPPRMSHSFTRGGPLTELPTSNWGEIFIGSDNRKPVVFSAFQFFRFDGDGSRSLISHVGLRWKPSSNFSISLNPEYQSKKFNAQWVTGIEDSFMTGTYGSRYIFGAIDQKTVSCSVRLNWIFSPVLSLQAYIQPFIAVGSYGGFKELARPGSFDFNRFGEGGSAIFYDGEDGIYFVDPDGVGGASEFSFGNPDFNFKSLRGTVVMRWEYRPGSTVYVVWTQNRADYANPGDFRLGRDLGDLFRAPGDDIFMVKFTYRFKI